MVRPQSSVSHRDATCRRPTGGEPLVARPLHLVGAPADIDLDHYERGNASVEAKVVDCYFGLLSAVLTGYAREPPVSVACSVIY
jgi:hypothetical protein